MAKKFEGDFRRGGKPRLQKTRIFMSCEGKTEATYFESLNSIYPVRIRAKYDDRTSAIDVVKNFDKLFANEDIEEDDLKFCVFDCDDNSSEHLKAAEKLAKQKGIDIIFSNPCFEIWLYWHFKNSMGSKTSNSLKTFIASQCGFPDYKNDKSIAKKLNENLKKAINTAIKSDNEHKKVGTGQYSVNSNPSTGVYKLFQRINVI